MERGTWIGPGPGSGKDSGETQRFLHQTKQRSGLYGARGGPLPLQEEAERQEHRCIKCRAAVRAEPVAAASGLAPHKSCS